MSVHVGPARAVNVLRLVEPVSSTADDPAEALPAAGADDLGDEDSYRDEDFYRYEDFYCLFVGEPDESAADAAVRNQVAYEVYAELLAEGIGDAVSLENAEYAARLLHAAPLLRRVRDGAATRGARTAVALVLVEEGS